SHGAKIAMLGIPSEEMPIDWRIVIFNMLTIRGIYGREMYETWYKMTVMLQSGLDITPVITHRFSYHEFDKAFDLMASANSGKVILHGEQRPVRKGRRSEVRISEPRPAGSGPANQLNARLWPAWRTRIAGHRR